VLRMLNDVLAHRKGSRLGVPTQKGGSEVDIDMNWELGVEVDSSWTWSDGEFSEIETEWECI
jgi:hypothetical protein